MTVPLRSLTVALFLAGSSAAFAAPTAAPAAAQLSIVFVPSEATDPSLVIDFRATANASGTTREADISFFPAGRSVRKRTQDEALGRQNTLREFLPTPAEARVVAIDGAWMVTLQNVGEWQGDRPASRRPLSHDGPAVVTPTTARLTLDGTLLDIPRQADGPHIVSATLYGTWRAAPGHAIIRRTPADASTIVLVEGKSVRVMNQQETMDAPPFVVDTRAECGRPLPVASVVGWREEGRQRPKRAQLLSPAPWACGQTNDIAVVFGESRTGTRPTPLHGLWLRPRAAPFSGRP